MVEENDLKSFQVWVRVPPRVPIKKGDTMIATIATASVQVLNATYMPLGATHLGRAMALVSSGRAVVEEQDDTRIIRSGGGISIPFPKVIRLLTYLHVPFDITEEFWSLKGVIKRDKGICAYCEGKATTVDHIEPKSRFRDGGNANTWLNTIAACQPCNGKKANRNPKEANMPLRFEPTVPTKVYLRSGKKPRKKNRT